MNIKNFVDLANIFIAHGYSLYMVGGTARDFLLKHPIRDIDLATDATPDEMKAFVDGDYRFARFGCVKFKNMDITTFRKEQGYSDFRHPTLVKFTRNIKEDYVRRDFTINALYIDQNLKVYDFCQGLDDLKHKVIRTVGDPNVRFQEDPLRIVRAERFKCTLGFTIDHLTLKAMNKYKFLIQKISSSKLKEELSKTINNEIK